MTISPIGSPIQPPKSSDEPVNGNSKQAEPAANSARGSETEKVELSPGAQKIIDRQADVTRLQVADKAAANFEKEARAVQQMFEEHQKAGREMSRDSQDRIQEHIREAKNALENAKFGDEQLFDGRELRVRVEEKQETVRMPDRDREMSSFETEVREALKERREPVKSKIVGRLDKFRNRIQNLVKSLEKETRASIEQAVKESTATRPRDVADAERAIMRARVTRLQQRPQSMEKISQRAVDLLQ